jgi:hypothetical protein
MKYASVAVALLINSAMGFKLHHMNSFPDVTFLQEEPAKEEEKKGEEKKGEEKKELKPEFGNEGFNSGKDQAQVPCDGACKEDAKFDADKEAMIRHPDITNPMHDITWESKNNYDVYTTDHDPTHNHFDRIADDILDVQKTMKHIANLETKKSAPWTWTADGSVSDTTVTDTAVLNSMKEELGLEKWTPATGLKDLDVKSAINDAVASGNDNRGVNGVGFTKADGLEGSDKIYGVKYINTGYNNN